MTRSYDAVLFDMDGLMIDTEAVYADCWRQAGALLGLPLPETLIRDMVGLSSERCRQLVERHFDDPAAGAAVYRASREQYREQVFHRPVPLKPGIGALLDWLETENIPRAVATSTRREIADRLLARSGLGRYFAHRVTGDEVARPKPAPDIYLAAAGLVGSAPSRCIALEDSRHGMAAACAAGMRVIVVPDLVEPDASDRARALAVCATLDDALDRLRTL